MDQSIEIDDEASAQYHEESTDLDIPTTSSELEHHSGSEESK